MVKRKWIGDGQASYTLEAAIYIPMILFMLLQTLRISIGEWQESKDRNIYTGLYELDIVSEFYGYQILYEARKEIEDD